jgi:hypothetical protein
MKHREVYHYEVELKLINPNTTEARLVTREETAYNPIDAYTQALLAVAGEAGSADIKLVHVRPTADAIAASQQSLAKALADSITRAIQQRGAVKVTPR